MSSIDLNSDLGENTPDRHVADDSSMLKIVTSANVSGGLHAGNPLGIRRTLEQAKTLGVTVGAHPGYNDYKNFGRKSMDIDAKTLQADVEYQIGALLGLASSVGIDIKYVKPHGALYNAMTYDAAQAKIVISAIKAIDHELTFLGLSTGIAVELAEASGLKVAREAFIDRAYTADGSLLPRTHPGSVLSDIEEITQRTLRLVSDGYVAAADGSMLRLRADSICVHGDSPGAITMAAAVREKLLSEGIGLTSFVA